MKNSFLPYELKRIMKSRFSQIAILIVAFFPLVSTIMLPYISEEAVLSIFGVKSYTLLSKTILYPAKAGAIMSVVVFTALTVFEFDKILRFRVNDIIEPISSTIKINLTKVMALIFVGGIATVISIVTMIPYYIFQVGSLDRFFYLIISYTLIIFGAIILSVLMTAGFYLIFRKINVTCIVMFLAVLFSFLAGIFNYQYIWVYTGASGLSENFGTGNTFLGMAWNRLFVLTITMSIFLFGMMSNRCYEKGLIKSLFNNCKKYTSLLICFFISFGCIFITFENEPIFKAISFKDVVSILVDGNKETPINNNVKASSNMAVDLKIEKGKKYASGSYAQELQNTTDEVQDIYFELADGYCINEVKLEDKDIDYSSVSSNSLNSAKKKQVFKLSIPERMKGKLSINYSGSPKSISINGNFSLGINKDYISFDKACYISPVVCIEGNKGIEGTINLDSDLTLITSGEKNKQISEEDGLTKWSFYYDKPDDFCLTAGRYGLFERYVDGTNVEFFYPLAAQSKFEDRGNDTLDIFSFFSEKFGPLYRDSLKVVITSGVNGGGGYQNGNISYVSEDCLSKRTKEDSLQASISDIFALVTHEIAHQWWGDAVDVSNENSQNQEDKNHEEWSNEAFAEFSTYLFLKEKFGEEYAENLLLNKWEEGTNELNRSFYERNPEYINKLSMISKYYVSLFLRGSKIYGLGPLTVYKIYHEIGEDNYYNSMKVIYNEYYDKKDKKLSFTDFLNITGVSKEAVSNE